jgi:hypothetical protein
VPRQLVIMTVAGLLAAAFVGIGFIAAGSRRWAGSFSGERASQRS